MQAGLSKVRPFLVHRASIRVFEGSFHVGSDIHPLWKFQKKATLLINPKLPLERLREKFAELFGLEDPHSFIVALVSDDSIIKMLSNQDVTDVLASYSNTTHQIALYEIPEKILAEQKTAKKEEVTPQKPVE